MKVIDVRENTKDEDDKIHFQYGNNDIVYSGQDRYLVIEDARGNSTRVEESDIDSLIKALQLAKKEYFGE